MTDNDNPFELETKSFIPTWILAAVVIAEATQVAINVFGKAPSMAPPIH